MSRKHSPAAPRRAPRTRLVALLVASALIVIAVVLLAPGRSGPHPTPRAGVTAAHVMHHDQLPVYATAGAAAAYAIAARMPQTLDGIHCFCACDVSIGHHSLLSCFEDDHGAACEVCQIEATIAAGVLDRQGTLAEARAAVDARFKST